MDSRDKRAKDGEKEQVTNPPHRMNPPQSQPGNRLTVLMPAAVGDGFTYRAPGALPPGTLVEAPLGKRDLIGVVWDDAPDATVAEAKLKPIGRVLDEIPPLPEPFRRLIDWVARFTLAPRGAVLALAGLKHAARTTRSRYQPPRYTLQLPTLSAEQQAVSDCIRSLTATRDEATPKPILLDGVTGSGKTEVYFHAIAQVLGLSAPREGGANPPSNTECVAPKLREPLAAGVSAKREGGANPPSKQVLVLVPEIALTHQWLARFTATFGAEPAVWHSGQTPAAKARLWQAVARGEARVVVGARSALFLPFAQLGLIVVDEEHDPSYKQEDGVLYHARDMAVMRGRLEPCPVLLVSATPSLETLENVCDGKYDTVHLPARFGVAEMPEVALVDLRSDKPESGEFLSPTVKNGLLDTLARGEQALLFLNRRGYAPLLLCRGCGHRFQCPDCSAWLVLHGKLSEGGLAPPSKKQRLHCHHCGHRAPMPPACPACEAPPEKLAACGPGVERIAEEVNSMFEGGLTPPSLALTPAASGSPSATRRTPSLAVLSSDEAIAAETWGAIERGEVDILIGTQMAAKGHHFPNLTFVAVVDGDLGLDGADLRAGERSYQLLHQLAGRAGRGEKPGRVLIQTTRPEHPVMQALLAHDRDAVMAEELAMRRLGGWPPYGQLAAILLDGVDEIKVKQAGQALARSAPVDGRIRVLGPAPAPLSRLRGQYRYRLLIKAEKGIHLQKTLSNWLQGARFSGVRIKLDVNPYYFM